MLNVIMICGDTLFSRMLELECSDVGFAVTKYTATDFSVNELISGLIYSDYASFVCVADADFLTNTDKLDEFCAAAQDNRLRCVFFGQDEFSSYTSSLRHYSYYQKPFAVASFITAVEYAAGMKKSEDRAEASPYNPADDLRLYPETKLAVFRGHNLYLTPTEYAVLSRLYNKRGYPLSREDIQTMLYGEQADSRTNIVDVYIRFLRKKIDDTYHVKLIHTVRGLGYMIKK